MISPNLLSQKKKINTYLYILKRSTSFTYRKDRYDCKKEESRESIVRSKIVGRIGLALLHSNFNLLPTTVNGVHSKSLFHFVCKKIVNTDDVILLKKKNKSLNRN